MSKHARIIAAIIALIACTSVLGQLIVNAARPEYSGWIAAAWSMAAYFTILTNFLAG